MREDVHTPGGQGDNQNEAKDREVISDDDGLELDLQSMKKADCMTDEMLQEMIDATVKVTDEVRDFTCEASTPTPTSGSHIGIGINTADKVSHCRTGGGASQEPLKDKFTPDVDAPDEPDGLLMAYRQLKSECIKVHMRREAVEGDALETIDAARLEVHRHVRSSLFPITLDPVSLLEEFRSIVIPILRAYGVLQNVRHCRMLALRALNLGVPLDQTENSDDIGNHEIFF